MTVPGFADRLFANPAMQLDPWIGVRIWNSFDTFLPWDVQANTGSSNFGRFYNSEYRQFRIQVRFER